MSPTPNGSASPPSRSLVGLAWNAIQERVNGFWEFIGFIFCLIFSLGLALCQDANIHQWRTWLLGAGGFLLGFFGPRTRS